MALGRGSYVGLEHLLARDDIPENAREEIRRELAERSRIDALLDAIPDTIYFKDAESRFTHINQAQARTLGLDDPSEAIGKTDADFFVEDHARDALIDERIVLATGDPLVDKTERIRRADGEYRWVSTTKIPLRNDEGAIVGVAGLTRDMHGRFQAEVELRRREEQYRSIFDNSPVALWELDFSRTKTLLDDAIRAGDGRLALAAMDERHLAAACGRSIRVLRTNDAALALFGLESRADVPADVTELWDAETFSAFGRALPEMVGGARAIQVQTIARDSSGEQKRILLRWSVLPGHEDTWERCLLSMVDISAVEAAERARIAAEDRFRRIFESSPMGMFVFELMPDGRLILRDANPSADRILGVSCAEFVGLTIEQAFPPLAETEVPDAYRRVARTGEPWFTEQVDYSHGEIAGAYEVHAFQTQQSFVAVMFLDITDRRRAEEQQERQSRRLQAVVSITNELIECADEDAVFRRVVELSRERLRVERCAIFVPEGDMMRGTYGTDDHGRTTDEHGISFPKGDRWREPLSTGPGEGPVWTVRETTHSYWDGSRLVDHGQGWVAYTPIQSAGNLPIGIMTNDAAISGDPLDEGLQEILTVLCSSVCYVAERRRAEEQQRELESKIQHTQKLESLGVLAGGIAHDFNNILMGVLGNASLALAQLPAESPGRDCIQNVETAATRAAELSKQMLAYSGRGRFVVERLNLSRLVREMSRLLESSISKKALLRCELPDDLPPVEADATQLRQIAMNLITNASDALGEDGGVLTVATGVAQADRAYLADTFIADDLPQGDYVYLEVSDTGCGMDEETVARIFDPFFSTKPEGRGLGMAAVLGIVRGHGGAIKVYSEPGSGTTVKVLFPAAAGSANATDAARTLGAEGEWQGSGTVLVADDEPAVLQVAKMTLEMAGFSVLEAKDGQEAVNLFRERADEIVAVLLDMTMPRMSGEQAYSELRRLRPNVAVILSSGFNEQDATSRLAGKGFAAFIQKPYRPAELVEQLRQVLQG